MYNIGLPLMLIIMLVLTSGYLTFMETVVKESHKSRLEKLTEDERVFNIIEKPERFIFAAQTGITTSVIIAGFISILTVPILMESPNFFLSAVIAIIVITLVMLLLGEFLPQKLARQAPEQHLLKYNRSFRLIEILMRPLVIVFSKCADGIMLIMGMNIDNTDTVTEDEVKDLIEQGKEDGTIDKEEQEMVDRIFQLGDETAYSLMTPRTQMVWLDMSDSAEHNLKVIRDNPDTIIPVGSDNLDNCQGIIYAKDLLNSLINTDKVNEIFYSLDLTEFLKKPLYIPRSMEAFRLVEKFRSTGVHEAVVLDEYGGVVGFITLNDIMEEIIGTDENASPESDQFSILGKNSWFVDGLYDVDDFKKQFNVEKLPEEEQDHYQTMGGFLTSYFGYIPKVGEACEWNGLRFEVARMDRARIDKIRITRINSK